MPILLKNNPGSGPEPGFIDKAAYSRYKRLHSQPAMQYPSNQPHSGAWLGLPPDEERPVGRGARYRCILLMLLYWALLSAVPQGADRYAEIGTVLPAWMGALELTPFLLVPAFLFLAVRTGAQWRALMIAVYAGLLLNLLMNLALPAGAMWGDLPAAGPYGTLVWPAGTTGNGWSRCPVSRSYGPSSSTSSSPATELRPCSACWPWAGGFCSAWPL